jgi:hypothetical protein
MTWLLRLYPAPWRRRYGDEVAGMIADRRFSLRIAVDLVAGAIDVWLHPSVTLAAAAAAEPHTEAKTMLSRLARFDCTGALGPDVTRADKRKANMVTLGGTVVLTLIWMSAHIRAGDTPYLDALSPMAFIVPMLLSMRYTSLKKRPASVQAVFIGGFSVLLTLFLLGAGWIAARL